MAIFKRGNGERGMGNGEWERGMHRHSPECFFDSPECFDITRNVFWIPRNALTFPGMFFGIPRMLRHSPECFLDSPESFNIPGNVFFGFPGFLQHSGECFFWIHRNPYKSKIFEIKNKIVFIFIYHELLYYIMKQKNFNFNRTLFSLAEIIHNVIFFLFNPIISEV